MAGCTEGEAGLGPATSAARRRFEAQVFEAQVSRTSFSGIRGTRSGPSVPASGSVGDRRAKNRLNEGEDSGEPSRAREACGLSWNFSGRPWPSFGEAWVLKLNAGIAHGRPRASSAGWQRRAERGSARAVGEAPRNASLEQHERSSRAPKNRQRFLSAICCLFRVKIKNGPKSPHGQRRCT